MIKYRNALVTYLDILGFSAEVTESCKNPQQVDRLASILGGLKHLANLPEKYRQVPKDGSFRFFSFSDHVVRAKTVDDSSVKLSTAKEIAFLALLQLELLTREVLEQVLLRGSVCRGSIHFDDDGLLFGPALVQAHEIESNFAVFPRIVVDRDLAREHVSLGDEYVRRGEDGVYFIDYLFGVLANSIFFTSPGMNRVEKIKEHRDFILRSIQKIHAERDEGHVRASRIRQKYLWLALYHNTTISRLRDELDELKREPDDVFDSWLIPEDKLGF